MTSLLPLSRVVLGSGLLGLMATLGACSSESPSGGSNTGGTQGASAGSGSVAGTSSPAEEELHGSVVVSLNAPEGDGAGYSTLIGRFFSAMTPDPFPLKLDSEAEGCQLKVPNLPFCSESCAPDVCTADEVCTPHPDPVSVGALSVQGLGAALSLSPATSLVVYQSPSLAYPPCEAGTKVSASADRFSLEAECLAPLELTGPDPLPVKSGEVVHVTWVPAPRGASSRVRIGLDVSHHGGKKGQIDCEVPDTGSFDIPEGLVTKLIALGLAGYPTINVNRVSVGVDARNDAVSLVLSSSITRAVDTGVKSCQDDAECDEGQECSDVGLCE